MSTYNIQPTGTFDNFTPGTYDYQTANFSVSSTNGTLPSGNLQGIALQGGSFDQFDSIKIYHVNSVQPFVFVDTTPPPYNTLFVPITATFDQMNSSQSEKYAKKASFSVSTSNGTKPAVVIPFSGGFGYKSKTFSFFNLGGSFTGQIYPRNFTVFREAGPSSVQTPFGTFTTASFKASTQKRFLQFMTYPRSLY